MTLIGTSVGSSMQTRAYRPDLVRLANAEKSAESLRAENKSEDSAKIEETDTLSMDAHGRKGGRLDLYG